MIALPNSQRRRNRRALFAILRETRRQARRCMNRTHQDLVPIMEAGSPIERPTWLLVHRDHFEAALVLERGASRGTRDAWREALEVCDLVRAAGGGHVRIRLGSRPPSPLVRLVRDTGRGGSSSRGFRRAP